MEVDRDILQVALSKAITEAVPPEMQKEIFSRALHEHLFKTNRDGRSPISEAFQRALDDATRDLAREIVRDPENMIRVKDTIHSSLTEALESKSLFDKVLNKLLSAYW